MKYKQKRDEAHKKTEEESIEFNLFADWCLIRLYFLHIFLCECKGTQKSDWISLFYTLNSIRP